MNRVLSHSGVKYPIVQAPMGWIARSQLASAVSNAGGLGVIETSSGEVDQCLAEIARMKELTTKPFGVNLPILFIREHTIFPHGKYDDIVDTTSMALAHLAIWLGPRLGKRPVAHDFAFRDRKSVV